MKAWTLVLCIFIGTTSAGLVVSAANWIYLDYQSRKELALLKESLINLAGALGAAFKPAPSESVRKRASVEDLLQAKLRSENRAITQSKLDSTCENWRRWYKDQSTDYNKLMMDKACRAARNHRLRLNN